MTDQSDRIEQFRKMAEADPDNELGHFSLGRTLLDAGRFADAASSLQRSIQLNPKLSRAYQLLAMALLNLNQREAAISHLTDGIRIADERGDIMPKNEMTKMLKDLGAPVPQLKTATPERPPAEGEVHCARCGRVMPRMAAPPFNHAQGRLIQERICADCWQAWIGMGTKVINELRLPLNDPQAQRIFDQHMMEFLNLK